MLNMLTSGDKPPSYCLFANKSSEIKSSEFKL
jgi:hypothetical protein